MPEGITAMSRHREGWRGAELDRLPIDPQPGRGPR